MIPQQATIHLDTPMLGHIDNDARILAGNEGVPYTAEIQAAIFKALVCWMGETVGTGFVDGVLRSAVQGDRTRGNARTW
ncbi:hypothetical protein [Arthrobacter sp. KK5.5]|uniref:hypothetical protein n=1 Tax=Arthrobacter sp. KK5.5 TaxID=3373084 RepID=UPI003EE58041